MTKKIRVAIPNFIVKTIKTDANEFGFTINGFYNEIFNLYVKDKIKLELVQKSKNNDIVQFNLSKKNFELYTSILRMYSMKNETEFWKRIFFNYSDKPKYKREELVFQNTIKLIKYGIKNELKMEVKYKDKVEIFEPYFIKYTELDETNYIYAYSEESRGYGSYKLSQVKVLRYLEEKQEHNNKEYLASVAANFDKYLWCFCEVKIKLTDKGLECYNSDNDWKPRIESVVENVYTFYCSLENAKKYFINFLEEAEILEPSELRIWFKEKFEKAMKRYV